MIYFCRICRSTVSQSRADNGSHFMTHDTRDPWPMTHDSRLLTTPVTVTVWRLRTLGRGKEVSMTFRFHTVPTSYVHNKCSSHQLIFLPWNFNRIWAFPRKSVRFRSCLLVSGHSVTDILKKVLRDSQNNSFDCRCWFSMNQKITWDTRRVRCKMVFAVVTSVTNKSTQ